jgi:hypothetical protein
MHRILLLLCSAFAIGCAGRSATTLEQSMDGTYGLSMAVCSSEVIDVVVRYRSTAVDTIMTVIISGSPTPASARDSLLRTCGTIIAVDYTDSVTAIASVGSRSIPCIAHGHQRARIAPSPPSMTVR